MAYIKTVWVDDDEPAINAENLNKIEDGIYQNSLDIEELGTDIADLKDTLIPLSTDTIDALGLDSSDSPTVSDGLITLSSILQYKWSKTAMFEEGATISSASSISFFNVEYANDMWGAVVTNQTTNGYSLFYQSADGVTWTGSTIITYGYITEMTSVCFGDGIWVVGGLTGNTSYAPMYYSTDTTTWTAVTFDVNAFKCRAMTYSNGLFVAVGSNTTSTSNCSMYSTDGINWTSGNTPTSITLYGVAYGDGKFVAVGQDVFIYSIDGINWTGGSMPTSLTYNGVAYGDGKFVAVGDSGIVAYSIDGINWTSGNMPYSYNYKGIGCGDGKFIAVGGGDGAGAITAYSYVNSNSISGATSPVYVYSPDRNTYQDSGVLDGWTYEFIGLPYAQVETGSYVGTGTYGEDNPTELTFGFVPKFVIIATIISVTTGAVYNSGLLYPQSGFWNSSCLWVSGQTRLNIGNATDTNWAYVTTNDTTLSFYSTPNATYQLNNLSYKYNYIAIG